MSMPQIEHSLLRVKGNGLQKFGTVLIWGFEKVHHATGYWFSFFDKTPLSV